MELKMGVPKGFDLEKSVCNHGFFMMAPNRWTPSTKTFVRPLRLPDDSSVTVSISQPSPTYLLITILDDHDLICPSHFQHIKDQVKRMLRLSPAEQEKLKDFHKLHVDAAKKGFGRLFRSPSLFEDLVKSLLLCGTKFKQTLEMAEALCILQKRINLKEGIVRNAKRGRRKQSHVVEDSWGNFPNAQELVILEKKKSLQALNCKLGLRAEKVLYLANCVTDGTVNLMDLEKLSDGNELYPKLMRINGFGEFVTSNALMCMGFYDRIPSDTETVRLIKQVHQRKDCEKKNMNVIAKEIYDKYAPFQTLAYWSEMVDYYEKDLGKLSLLDRCRYKNVAGSLIDRSSSSGNLD